ncbi:hypothetical protein FB107DRAFT_288938 [Schizophyllum commune]
MHETEGVRTPSEAQQFRLLDLPPDAVEVVLSLSRPFNVLAMRETCTALHEASRKRWVWLTIAQRTAFIYGMPLSPFERAAMSLSDLERFATAPGRSFRALVAASGPFRAGRDALLREMYPRSEAVYAHLAGQFGFYDLIFVFPGGAYFMITNEDEDMTLYRLHPHPKGPEQLGTLFYSARGERDRRDDRHRGGNAVAAHQFLQDGTVLQIVTWGKTSCAAEPWKISVFNIALEGKKTGFRLVASTSVPLRLDYMRNGISLCDTRIAIADDSRIVVWDFALDRRVSWTHSWDTMVDQRVLLHENRVLLMGLILDPAGHLISFGPFNASPAAQKPGVRAKISVFEIPAGAVGPISLWPGISMSLGQDQFLHCPRRMLPGAILSFQVHTRRPGEEGLLHTYTPRRDLESTRRSPAHLTVPPAPGGDEHFAETSAIMMTACDVGEVYFEEQGNLGYNWDMNVHLAWPGPVEEQMLHRGSVRLVQSLQFRAFGTRMCRDFDAVSGRYYTLLRSGGLLVADYI